MPASTERVPVRFQASASAELMLRESGGKSGNVLLRQHLGWDEPACEAVKSALIASGRVLPGKGRGGSVLMPVK